MHLNWTSLQETVAWFSVSEPVGNGCASCWGIMSLFIYIIWNNTAWTFIQTSDIVLHGEKKVECIQNDPRVSEFLGESSEVAKLVFATLQLFFESLLGLTKMTRMVYLQRIKNWRAVIQTSLNPLKTNDKHPDRTKQNQLWICHRCESQHFYIHHISSCSHWYWVWLDILKNTLNMLLPCKPTFSS